MKHPDTHDEASPELREAAQLLDGYDVRPFDLQRAQTLILLDIAHSLHQLACNAEQA